MAITDTRSRTAPSQILYPGTQTHHNAAFEPPCFAGSGFVTRDLAQATLNAIADAVLSTDVAGNVVYLNVAAQAMTGWSHPAAVGRAVQDVFRIIDGESRDLLPER